MRMTDRNPSKPSKVWLISEVYYPEDTGTGYYMTGVAEGLALDFDVHVLCSQPTYAARGSFAAWAEIHEGVHVERCPGTTFNKDILILRLVNAATISISLFLKALWRIRKADVVIVVTNPPLLPFFIAIVCHLRGAKCILRVDDVYPEALIATGLARPDSLVVRVMSWVTKLLYQSVDQIVVLGRDMKQLVIKKAMCSPERVSVIPIWADVGLIGPAEKATNSLLSELGLADKFIVQCAGNMGRAQGVENMLKAAELLKKDDEIQFLFIGAGAKKRWMENEVQRKDLNNVALLGQRPRSDQANFLNSCDVAMVSLLSGMTGAGVPSRLYNIMAAGKPVIAIAGATSELSLVVQEEQVGWNVPPDRPEKLVEAILEAQASSDQLLQMGKHARDVVEAKYTRTRVIESYIELLSGFTPRKIDA